MTINPQISGLTIPTNTTPIISYINSNDFSVEYKNNCLNQEDLNHEQLIAKMPHLRGGAYEDPDLAFKTALKISLLLTMAKYGGGFQPKPHLNVIPLKTQQRMITVQKQTQNGNFGKNTFDYQQIMRKLNSQGRRKNINIQVGDEAYILKNTYYDNAYELGEKLADQMYTSIRQSNTDVAEIAKNLNYKIKNIKKIKDHIFNNNHILDRYDSIEYKQFDPNL